MTLNKQQQYLDHMRYWTGVTYQKCINCRRFV